MLTSYNQFRVRIAKTPSNDFISSAVCNFAFDFTICLHQESNFMIIEMKINKNLFRLF